jgi:CRP/FNR family transcriptional regulator
VAPGGWAELAALEKAHQVVDRARSIYRQGEVCHSIYAVRSGCVKTFVMTEDGGEHVTGFHLPGEIIGLHGMDDRVFHSSAIALERAHVCALPLAGLEALFEAKPRLMGWLVAMLGREVAQARWINLVIQRCDVAERVEAFLIDLWLRRCALGLPAQEFKLSMSRRDLGSYLGVAAESVSRVFSDLQRRDILAVHGKTVRLNNVARLTDRARSLFEVRR